MARCVFCGEGAASREHVIPQWLDEPIKGSRPLDPGRVRIGITHRYTPSPESGSAIREWSAPGPDLVTKEICKTCNNERLSQLETTIRSEIGEMVMGHPVEIESEAQVPVASWAYKTILLIQLVKPGEFTLIPRERYAEFYRLCRPPTDTRIWLGAVIQGSSILHEVTTPVDMTTLRTSSPGYFAALTIGNLLILCGGRLSPSDEPLRVETRAAGRALLPLWPASIRSLNWPPPTGIEDLSPASLVELI
jgi:hypothetical protein